MRTLPKTELAEVGMQQQVRLAAVFKIVIILTRGHPLKELRKARLDRDAVIFKPGPGATPVAGEG
jgi:hypothetical protein